MRRSLLLLAAASSLLLGAGEASVQQRLLAAHNKARADFGALPLRWNEALAADAAKWARTIASTGKFEHADQSRHGENLWEGSEGAFTPEIMVGDWVDEKKYFKPGRFPAISTTPDWADVGHYTQIVWPATTDVGCAIVNGSGNDVLVCRYSPPGNVIGKMIEPLAVAPDKIPAAKSRQKGRR